MTRLLEPHQRQDLLIRHRGERDRRQADRIKAVILYDEGWSYAAIAHALLLSDEAIRKHIEDFIREAKLKPENGGSEPRLDDAQTAKLLAHLDEHLYVDAQDICNYVWVTFGVAYSRSGMTQWLKRNGFTYHKPVPVPAKADEAAQKAFIAFYENLKKTLSGNEKIVFMDGVHPTHQTRMAYGWIRKGGRKELPTTSGQKRMNILGALDLEEMRLMHTEFAAIDGEAVLVFLKNLEVWMPDVAVIHVILDRARYHTCPAVLDYVKTSRIQLHHLPSYSPNLNSIERVWQIMHEHTTDNHYYPTFKQFTEAILAFFKVTFPQNSRLWIDRISDNFIPIQSPILQV